MEKNLLELYDLASQRKKEPLEGSYTSYLLQKGLDKILKKCGEECSEMIIAAKNNDNIELSNEIADLLYHIVVLCVERNLPLDDINKILEQRREKMGNLKTFYTVDKNS